MADPITWQALESIKTMIAGITQANDFYTDLGLAPVYLDRSQNVEGNAPFTVAIANEITVNEDKSSARTLSSTMDLTVEYCIPLGAGTINPELLAHQGRADIVNALLGGLRGQVKGFTSLQITGTRITSAVEPGSSLVIAQVSARAGLSESKPPAT